jgi:hypothetical protein
VKRSHFSLAPGFRKVYRSKRELTPPFRLSDLPRLSIVHLGLCLCERKQRDAVKAASSLSYSECGEVSLYARLVKSPWETEKGEESEEENRSIEEGTESYSQRINIA